MIEVEHWTNYRCAECGFLTISGSIYGCVKCLTKREPEPIEVIPNAALEELRAALADLVATADAARAKSWNDVDTLRAFLDALERGRSFGVEKNNSAKATP